jgi:hypothetical protein
MRFLPVAALVMLCPAAGAHEIDISLNSDAVRGIYATDVLRNGRADFGWLHDKDAGDVFHGGLLITGEASSGPQAIRAGLGGRLVWLNGDGSRRDGYGLALGGRLQVAPPDLNRFTLAAEAFLAPDLLTGGDTDSYLEFGARVAYSVTRQADLYVGGRYVRADFDRAADLRFDTGFHVGIDLRF